MDIKTAIEIRNEVLGPLTPFQRVTELALAIGVKKDLKYQADSYQFEYKFSIGDAIVVFNKNYYRAKVVGVSKMKDPTMKKVIPCYKVHYEGRKTMAKSNQWINENCIFGLEKHIVVCELLCAHFYNEQRRLQPGIKFHVMDLTSVFKLNDSLLETYLSDWSVKFGKALPDLPNIPFLNWIGLM